MGNRFLHINEDNLSIAWAKTFVETMKHSELSPVTVTVTGLDNHVIPENNNIRDQLDASLKNNSFNNSRNKELKSSLTVANTIFPNSLWNRNRDRTLLYERYLKIRKPIRKSKGNDKGVYFERLIAYGDDSVNQLEFIIKTYTEKGNHRRSALQASVFDPNYDATHQPRRGFPCLQQVGFAKINENELCVTGYYPKEYIYDRGYGNYLGLCLLGQFVATQIGLKLSQMTCFVGVACTSDITKGSLRDLEKQMQIHIDNYERENRKYEQ